MKQTKKITIVLVMIGVVLIGVLIFMKLNGNFNTAIHHSSQVKDSSTFEKKSYENIFDKSNPAESSEPAKSDSFAADQHVTGQEIKLARQDLKRAGIDADKLSDEEISV
ncbi:MAG: hypothetical protein GX453_08965 [Lactococcus chungangensis]|uniref:Uncharacterized protein n=1 Tax=Pseudolactococcus chungangensis TaxID=451457 RepID=A0A847J5B7_9LACT|nr:hypothetical protein [Lactococcus chungangensis]